MKLLKSIENARACNNTADNRNAKKTRNRAYPDIVSSRLN